MARENEEMTNAAPEKNAEKLKALQATIAKIEKDFGRSEEHTV